jgi:cyclohexanone monooxygenase
MLGLNDSALILPILGPNTGVGGTSMTLMLEAQASLIGKCVDKVRELNLKSVEVKATVQDKFNKELHEFMKQIVWTSDKADSWFKTSEGKVTVKWPHQTEVFEQLTREFKVSDYQLEDSSLKSSPSRDSFVTLKAS